MTIYRANASGIQAPMRGVSRQRYTCFLSAKPTLNSEAFPQQKEVPTASSCSHSSSGTGPALPLSV